jgi:outer membrane protein
MKHSIPFAALLLAIVAPWASGAALEIYGGVGLWNGAFDGTVRSGATGIDVDDDLDVGRDRHLVLHAGVEHPVPLLPNLRVQYTDLDVSGRTDLPRGIAFRGVTFPAGTTVRTHFELTQIDGTLYYKLWGTGFEVDLGLTLRYIDGRIDIAAENQSAQADVEIAFPMLHAGGRVTLPLTGLWAGGRIDGAAFRGDSLIDASLGAGWRSPLGLGLEAGWRLYRIEIDGRGDLDRARIDVSGPYAVLNFRF